MECPLVVRTVNYESTPVHIFKIIRADHVFARTAEFMVWNTARATGALNRAIAKAGLPAATCLKRASLPHLVALSDYDAMTEMYREFQLSLDPTSNRGAKMLSIVPVSTVVAIAIAHGRRDLLLTLGAEVPAHLELGLLQQDDQPQAKDFMPIVTMRYNFNSEVLVFF